MEIFIRIVLFSLFLTWAISLQLVNQFSTVFRTKIISIIMSLVFSVLCGLVVLL